MTAGVRDCAHAVVDHGFGGMQDHGSPARSRRRAFVVRSMPRTGWAEPSHRRV
ncbi:hypothetical protein BSLA_02f0569 [Burkholderia stabilis]|nr:hypothetical protein BSLA_02f0569 [Burkholderia stabilis]